jgi:hypothetical protein
VTDSLRSCLIAGLIILLLAFCLTDCTVGRNRFCPGIIRQHVYHPPYSTLSCSHSKSGTTCHTVYHPAEYRILVDCQNPSHVAYINVGVTGYAHFRDNQPVEVGERLGRWTGIIWIDWIESETSNQY